ncbi:MAG TPA: ABC transporter permease [Vicinamibacterales bacterium]|nr:ABC transporter permease [Vicinamibacterales bacterium]
MDTLLRAARYSARQFRQSRGFTAAAILTLALGIGGTTAIFSLIYSVMLRSLPVADPTRLYRIGDGDDCCVEGGPQDQWGMYSYPLFQRLVAQAPEFESVTAFQAGSNRVTVRREGVDGAPHPLRSEYVTGNYFSTLGIGAFGGRVMTPDDDTLSSPPVVVISHQVWSTVYGGDPSVVGSTVIIDSHPFTVIGVTPPGFYGATLRADPPDVWIPVHQEPTLAGSSSLLQQPVSAWLRAIGRLKPGVSLDLRAGGSADAMSARLTQVLRDWMQHDSGYPANWMPSIIQGLPKQHISIVYAGAGVGEMKDAYRQSLQILLGVCALVLLIACANVANLMLARAVARRTQTAVRVAMGASRAQIVTQALIESVLLAIGGGIAGLLVASAAMKLLLSLAFSQARFLPIDTRPSLVMLGVSFGLALVTGVLFGAAPAWFATRTDPVDALRGAGRSTGDHSSVARKALLVAQATMSVVLVAGATMLGRSLNKLEHQDFGYETKNRVVVQLNREPSTYSPAKLAAIYRALETRLKEIPGVQGAGLALYNPLTDNWGEGVLVDGHPLPKPGEPSGASWDRVSADYLQNFGVKLIKGRMLNARDNETSQLVAVVNEAFVKRFFKSDEDPLDRYFGLDLPEYARTFRIVGIVGDAKFAGFQLDRPARPMFYVPLAQTVPYKDVNMMRIETESHFVRAVMLVTTAAPGVLEPQLTKALAEIDPNLTITNVRTMDERVALSFNQARAVASLAALFGVIALILAAVGLYGVTAYSVAQRTSEIGIRMALGANRAQVVDLILRGAFRRVVVGLLLGVPLAIGAGRLVSSQLYGVSFWDPLALSIAAGSLTVCAFFAALIPATRAASLSPMRALRTD